MADWPDWCGATAVIVATGPSAKDAPLIDAKDRARFIVIKRSWRLAPWADVLYGCDRRWWIEHDGVPQFDGLKVSAWPKALEALPYLRLVSLVARAEILTGEIGVLGCGLRSGGGHSGFHAINLAIQFGAKRIALVGFDMRVDRGAHWHSDDRKAWRTDARQMESCRAALDGCADQFKVLGVEVINCSPVSALKNYPKMSLMEALDVSDRSSASARPLVPLLRV